MKELKNWFLLGILIFTGLMTNAQPIRLRASVQLKIPGNKAIEYPLDLSVKDDRLIYQEPSACPIKITGQLKSVGRKKIYTITLKATNDVYFNFKQSILANSFVQDDCQFLMPGFWYRKNLRSPKSAPSFHTSDSWLVREDRLSTPLTGVFNKKTGQYYTVLRGDKIKNAAYSAAQTGEVILSGNSDIGFTGFENCQGKTWISFGFPYREAPKTYVRKSTLAPSVTAFEKLCKGEEKTLTWIYYSGEASDYSDFIAQVWSSSFDYLKPQPVHTDLSFNQVKDVLSNYFLESYVATDDLNYYAGTHLSISECKSNGAAELGFLGRVLLNAFFALEYAEETGNQKMKKEAESIFDSYLKNGFTSSGYFREYVNYDHHNEATVFSIRRQSEAAYAILKYLQYEKNKGRMHTMWETRLRTLFENFEKLQKANGSFPRKFDTNGKTIDESGGSTPSATIPLVMACKYFGNKNYLLRAKRTGRYLETEIITKGDYFSSTLDANCEDKEASLYAATAMYYLSLASKGKESKLYRDLAKQAAYFALTWYYTWDVPFAQGQMLGDIGLKSRGWGNVSVENNHIDVFVFELFDVLNWLASTTNEHRFRAFSTVIKTSMMQLLPYPGHMCGIGKVGYYPEVVQHTNWDYGKNGKGFYNTQFAPGWTVASLWQLLSSNSCEK
ncbi:MAG: hypothetical protein N4A71_22215 [Carboxylicivirga sp.]|jgi:hypothetical protein|nr:hypothetical protein [Carboxylicivirga sp.]